MMRFEIGDRVRVKSTGETATVTRVDTNRHGTEIVGYVVKYTHAIGSNVQAGFSCSPNDLEPSDFGAKLVSLHGKTNL